MIKSSRTLSFNAAYFAKRPPSRLARQQIRAANESRTWERFVESKSGGNAEFGQRLNRLFQEPVFREARRPNIKDPAVTAADLAKLQGYVTLEADRHREPSLWFADERPTLWAQSEIRPANLALPPDSILPDLLWVKKTSDTNYLCFAYAFTTQSKFPRNIRTRLDSFEKLYPGPAWSVRLTASGDQITLSNDVKFGPVAWIMKAAGSGLSADHPEGTIIPTPDGSYRHLGLGARRAELLANARAIREELLA